MTYATNTLLSPTMILAKAMVMAERAAAADEEPFEIAAELVFSSEALTYSIDDFSERYLQAAISAALETKRPLAEWREFEPTSPFTDMEACASFAGIAGRLLRFYDLSRDVMPTRIEMRASDGATRREARRLLEEEWEARRRVRDAWKGADASS